VNSLQDPTTAVPEGAALNLRVMAMRRTLELARAAIPLVKKLDPLLADRLGERFERRADEITASLRVIDPHNLEECERRLGEGEDLVGETLAYLAAAGARSVGLDQGTTTLALRWLDQLSAAMGLPKVAVVIPAVTEITGMVSSVMRLRVPSDGVWGLPVAVHEYGHFVAAHLTRRQIVEAVTRSVTPVEDLLHRASTNAERPVLYAHGHELFADAFAAATAGPAYTHYCIGYRFSPATVPTATHPSTARRIRVQLAVLNQMASADPTYYLSSEVLALQKRWDGMFAAAGVPPNVPADSELDQLESDLVSLVLEDEILKRVLYDDHMSASALAERELQTEERFTVAHIINAAWSARSLVERTVTDPGEAAERINILAARAYNLLGKVIADG
jgi:hypothetical protein